MLVKVSPYKGEFVHPDCKFRELRRLLMIQGSGAVQPPQVSFSQLAYTSKASPAGHAVQLSEVEDGSFSSLFGRHSAHAELQSAQLYPASLSPFGHVPGGHVFTH